MGLHLHINGQAIPCNVDDKGVATCGDRKAKVSVKSLMNSTRLGALQSDYDSSISSDEDILFTSRFYDLDCALFSSDAMSYKKAVETKLTRALTSIGNVVSGYCSNCGK